MYRMGQEEIDAVAKVIASGELFKTGTSAREVFNCEDELKAKLGTKYAILMTSGKAALISALIGLGIGPGDEVIVPAYTYIATAIAVTAVGAIPVIAEADETLTLDPIDVEKKISKYTKAIIPVHIQGFPSNMDALTAIAKKYNIAVVEDACQSVGGKYKGKMLGSIGDAGAFSFNYFKVITSGEGGALFTNNKQLFERAIIYHDSSAIAYFGEQMKDIESAQFCGTEYRVGEITGALIRTQLKRLDGIIADLHKNRDALKAGIEDLYRIAPSNDFEGDCATALALRFDSFEEAQAFSKKFGGTIPFYTGKHVYTNWTPVMQKCGAVHPLMDPFKMEANKELNHNYSLDMCPKTLDYLKRTVYLGIDPDWDEKALEETIKHYRGL